MKNIQSFKVQRPKPMSNHVYTPRQKGRNQDRSLPMPTLGDNNVIHIHSVQYIQRRDTHHKNQRRATRNEKLSVSTRTMIFTIML